MARSLADSIADAAARGMMEALGEKNIFEMIVGSQLIEEEKLVGIYEGETRPPLLIRIFPYIPDFLTKPTRYLLAVTNHRLLIIQLTGKRSRPEAKRVFASIPLEDVEDVDPRVGMFTSSVTLYLCSGNRYYFGDMLRSSADKFADALFEARKQAKKDGFRLPLDLPVFESKQSNFAFTIGRYALCTLGGILVFASIGGFAKGDTAAAFACLLIGLAMVLSGSLLMRSR